jgi:hypothetical protein
MEQEGLPPTCYILKEKKNVYVEPKGKEKITT